MAPTKSTPYEIVTDKILAAMAEGTVPWHQPWSGAGARSMSSGKAYRGINVFLLAPGYWGTYKKITELGGQVRKGEKTSVAVFWKFIEKPDENGKVKTIPFLRYFRVLHQDQADWPNGLPEKFAPAATTSEDDRITAAEQILSGYFKREEGLTILESGDRACYSPMLDHISVPKLGQFESADSYYSTLFHEATHSTGHESRLNREGITNFDAFGSHQYAKEELVAEMGAAMLSSVSGIDSTIETSAAYLKHWASKISDDPKLVVQAAGLAQRAADRILDVKWGEADSDSDD